MISADDLDYDDNNCIYQDEKLKPFIVYSLFHEK